MTTKMIENLPIEEMLVTTCIVPLGVIVSVVK
jgi:hypothetical protein